MSTILITDAEAHIKAGRLEEALAAVQSLVRSAPAEPRARLFLFHLLCVLGQWERALNQLSVSRDLDAESVLLAQVFEPVVRAEMHRDTIFAGNAGPMIFGEPDAWLGHLVHANQLFAKGDREQAQKLRNEAFEAAPATSGTLNGEPFDWIADADSRLGPVLEVILNGSYYWVPFARIRAIDLPAPKELRDLVWIAAKFTWSNGGEAHGFIPARYPSTTAASAGDLRLARRTEWEEFGGDYYVGLGQRMLSLSTQDIPILEARTVELTQPAA